MRTVPHPVMVVSVDQEYGKQTRLRGMVVSSFNTVSLYPEAIVSFNVKLPSATYEAMVARGYFTVSALWAAETAQAFLQSVPGDETLQNRLASGTRFTLQCQWLKDKSIHIADHMVILGKVLHISQPDPTMATKAQLCYHHGQYYQSNPTVLRKDVSKRHHTADDAEIKLG